MRKAIEESQKLEEEAKKKYSKEEDEEAEMIRQAIEMSNKEEAERLRLETEEKNLMVANAPKETAVVADV
jgi:hypothetical protein|tara:strand:- start:30 stop:239 length:210 start_codon:yes stop_codon:yes gene_type:complete